MQELLLIVDMQNDFIDGSLGSAAAQSIVPLICQRAAAATAIIFTQDTHSENYLQTQEGQKLPIEHCLKATRGWEICAALKPYAKTVLEKPTFGCTQLLPLLTDYEKITLVGLCTDVCIISNALLLKAFYPEKTIVVDSRCCAGTTAENHAIALKAMANCQIEII